MIFFDDFTTSVKSHDHGCSRKGAHHDNDSAIFTDVSNRFNAAADQVQVNKGFAVQDTDRVTILGRAIDMALRIKRSCCHEKDRLCTDPPLNPLVDFLVNLAHRRLSLTITLPKKQFTVNVLIKFKPVPTGAGTFLT